MQTAWHGAGNEGRHTAREVGGTRQGPSPQDLLARLLDAPTPLAPTAQGHPRGARAAWHGAGEVMAALMLLFVLTSDPRCTRLDESLSLVEPGVLLIRLALYLVS